MILKINNLHSYHLANGYSRSDVPILQKILHSWKELGTDFFKKWVKEVLSGEKANSRRVITSLRKLIKCTFLHTSICLPTNRKHSGKIHTKLLKVIYDLWGPGFWSGLCCNWLCTLALSPNSGNTQGEFPYLKRQAELGMTGFSYPSYQPQSPRHPDFNQGTLELSINNNTDFSNTLLCSVFIKNPTEQGALFQKHSLCQLETHSVWVQFYPRSCSQ